LSLSHLSHASWARLSFAVKRLCACRFRTAELRTGECCSHSPSFGSVNLMPGLDRHQRCRCHSTHRAPSTGSGVQVLAADLTFGYHSGFVALVSVNGEQVTNIYHLAALCDCSQSEYMHFELTRGAHTYLQCHHAAAWEPCMHSHASGDIEISISLTHSYTELIGVTA
jgi:PDZ domain